MTTMDNDDIVYAQSDHNNKASFRTSVLHLVDQAGMDGLTDPELQALTGRGHGSTSGALSVLHKRGYIARLAEKRNRNSIYVVTRLVDERDTVPPMNNHGEATDGLEGQLRRYLQVCLSEYADKYTRMDSYARQPIRGRIEFVNQLLRWLDAR